MKLYFSLLHASFRFSKNLFLYFGAAWLNRTMHIERDLLFETRTQNKTSILVLCKEILFLVSIFPKAAPSFIFGLSGFSSIRHRQRWCRENHGEAAARRVWSRRNEKKRKSDRNQDSDWLLLYFFKRQIINNERKSEAANKAESEARHQTSKTRSEEITQNGIVIVLTLKFTKPPPALTSLIHPSDVNWVKNC